LHGVQAEVQVRKLSTLLALLLLVSSLSTACTKERKQTGTQQQTQTIAPAAAKPDQSGTNDALTQTVEVDDSRSEGEGGTAATTNAPAGTTTAPATAAPKKKKH
jgi:uncharacterized lipoprotein YajG